MKDIFTPQDFPSKDKDLGFWNLIEDKNLPRVIQFFTNQLIILAEPLAMSDKECRTQLSKIKAMNEFQNFLMTLPEKLISLESKEENETDEDKLSKL